MAPARSAVGPRTPPPRRPRDGRPGPRPGVPGAEITAEHVGVAVQRALVRYDRTGDQHYDVISAFIKSVRGSDVDAALHYLARMIEAGEDPRFIARRLVILASEDIGLADPSALGVATAAMTSVGPDRAARGPAAAGAGDDPPRPGPEVERRHPGHRRRAGRRPRRAGGPGAGAPARRALPERRRARASSATATRTTTRRACWPSSTPRTQVVGRRYYEPGGHGVEARLGDVLARLREALGPGAR